MPKIRVLAVDDSTVVRKLLTDTFADDPDIEIAGTAATGAIALNKLQQVNPDLITLDLEMEGMDGLQTLVAIRRTHPKVPVIMFCTMSERSVSATLHALSLGANDYLTKPTNMGDVAKAMACIRDELGVKVRGLCRGQYSRPGLSAAAAPVKFSPATNGRSPTVVRGIQILAIGVSTGGPNALADFLPGLVKDFPVPIVIVQHMPELFTRLLAERLAKVTGRVAREGENGAVLRPGEIWVAPGGFHMEVERVAEGVRLRTFTGPQENSCRPAVDVLFRSVARVYGRGALALVLTGMGSDGKNGCQHIREGGGRIFVQDELTSVVWGMPGAVASAGLADKVLPLGAIAGEINRLACDTPKPMELAAHSLVARSP